MTNDEYLDQWIIWHSGYEQRAVRIFRKAFRTLLSKIPLDNITYENSSVLTAVNTTLNRNIIEDAYIEVYTQIGLIHGNRVGRGINSEVKEYERPLFNRLFQSDIIEWVKQNCGLRITSVIDTIAQNIAKLVEEGLSNNLTVNELVAFLRRNLQKNILRRFEILRIARTETTGAANHGAVVSGEQSGILLEKVWISTKDSRTRRKPKNQFDHRRMDNVAVGQFEDFELRSKDGFIDKISYPGAPNGKAGDIINCRCACAFRPIRDKDGFVIRR